MNGKNSAAAFAAALVFLAAGGAIATGEAPRKAQACIVCHGIGGNPDDPGMPSLAGQPAQFIVMQLHLYREGDRKNALMAPIASSLSNADLNELAAYFSAQKPAAPSHRTGTDNIAGGRRLADQHYCTQCHGRELIGQQHIPRLAGQKFSYLKSQLHAYKARTRTDPDGTMTSAAQALSAADIEVLADYLAGLGAP